MYIESYTGVYVQGGSVTVAILTLYNVKWPERYVSIYLNTFKCYFIRLLLNYCILSAHY